LIFLFGLNQVSVISQNNILKIYSELVKSENDSIKVRRYFKLSDEYYEIKNYANSFKSLDTALKISENTKRQDLIALCYYKYGNNHSYLKEYVTAGKYLEKAAIIWQQQKNYKELARICFNYGNNYYFLSNTKRAITYYRLVLNYIYKSKDSTLLSDTYNNIWICNAIAENYELAKEYLLKAYQLAFHKKDTSGIAYYYNNIATIYNNLSQFDSSIVNFQKSKYYKVMMKDSGLIAEVNLSLSDPYFRLKNYNKALFYLNECKKFMDTTDYSSSLQRYYYEGYSIYTELNNFKLANSLLVKAYKIKDSLSRFQSLVDVEYQEKITEFKNSMVKDSLLNVTKIQQKNLEIKRSETIKYFMVLIIAIVGAFLLLLYKRFKIIQKQKKEIEIQKNIIEEKAQEIISSMTYAKRIQQSILPKESYLRKQLNKD